MATAPFALCSAAKRANQRRLHPFRGPQDFTGPGNLNYAELGTGTFNSVVICLGCIAIAVPIGSLLAVLLLRTDIWGKRFLWLALASQLTVPLYVSAGAWNAGFGTQGWWPLGQVFAVQFDLAAIIAVIFIHGVTAIPWVSLIVSLGLMWTSRSLEESALVEGGPAAVLRLVIAPSLRPWLALSCLWCCVPVLTEMVVSNLYLVPTVAERVYMDVSRGTVTPLTYPIAVALCVLPIFLATILVSRSLPPWNEMIARVAQHKPRLLLWRHYRPAISVVVWCLVISLVLFPIFNLVIKAGWLPRVDDQQGMTYSWSGARFMITLSESLTLFTREFYWSAVLAIVSATTACLLAAVLQWWMRARWQKWLVALTMILMIGTPGAIVGMLLIALLNRSEPAFLGELYDRTLLAPVLAQQFRLLPLALLMLSGLVATIDRRSWEIARMEGLSGWQQLRTILWPQTGSRWIIAWLILFVLSIGELSATILVLPPGVTTLSMRLFEMLHFGMRHQDSGLCLLLLAIGWLVASATLKTLTDRNSPVG